MDGLTFVIILLIVVFAVFVIRGYAKKLAHGCCGSGGDAEQRVKVKDKNKSHYPYTAILTVDGMMCSGCEVRIENALNSLDGVWAKASSSDGSVRVLMKSPLSEDTLRSTINDLGIYTLMKAEFQR